MGDRSKFVSVYDGNGGEIWIDRRNGRRYRVVRDNTQGVRLERLTTKAEGVTQPAQASLQLVERPVAIADFMPSATAQARIEEYL
jgi:hypothetical protein